VFDWVGFTDFRQLDQNLSVRLRTDSFQFWEDHVESFDGLLGVSDSGGVGLGVSSSVLLDEFQMVVDHNHLVLEGGDLGFEIGDLGSEIADFFDGLTDVGDGAVDSSIKIFDGLLTFSFSFSQ
jgi:hypothetical protein